VRASGAPRGPGAADLSEEEKTILWAVCRSRKLGPSRVFSEQHVAKKKPCWSLDVPGLLEALEGKGIVHRVHRGKGLWKVLRPEIAHDCELERSSSMAGMRIERK
jgi:hypothetical protein